MNLTKRILFFLLITSTVALPAIAEKPPSIELGFNPDRMYHFGELDSVNLFNGNLIVQIPIGDTYSTNAEFNYRLTLIYNGKVWDYRRFNDVLKGETFVYAEPNWRSNAGVGWRLSLGRLLPPSTASQSSPSNEDIYWIYESPTGEEHTLGGSDSTEVVQLTSDQSHLRMVRVSSTRRDIEFPNGEVHRFEKDRDRWRLRQISDRFGNHVSIASNWYAPSNTSDGREAGWTLYDYAADGSLLRTHYVTFLPASSLASGSLEFNDSIDQGQLVTSVKLAKAGGGLAEYTFEYSAASVGWGCGHHPDITDDSSLTGSTTTLPFLRRIVLPDAERTAFTFSYYGPDTLSAGAGMCGQGMLQTMELPTLGTMTYEYQQFAIPETTCTDGSYEYINPGVKSRIASDGRRWDYIFTLGQPMTLTPQEAYQMYSDCGGGPEAPGIPSPTVTLRPARRWARTSVLGPAVDYVANGATSLRRARSDSYFYVWPTTSPGPADGFGPPADIDNPFVGAPVTTGAPAPSLIAPCSECETDIATADDSSTASRRRLSTRTYEGCANDSTGDCTNGKLIRSTYLRLQTPAVQMMISYGPESSRTVFEDDPGCSGAACWIKATNSERDGAGNYRRTKVETNFPEGGGFETFTNFSTWTTALAFTITQPWVLGMYDRVDRTEGSVTATTEYCFEPMTGFLLGGRTRKNDAVRDSHDLLTVYARDASGNVVSEKMYGGDLDPVDTSQACPTMQSAPSYNLFHEYSRGRRTKTQYCAPTTGSLCGTSILTTLDLTLDASGAPTQSRDASGIPTSYAYDAYGRLQKITPPTQLASSEYAYSTATRSGGVITGDPLVTETVKDGSTTLAATRYEFDSFGRPWRVSKSLPNGKVSVIETVFDGLGRKKSISQPFELSAHPSGASSVGTLFGTNWTQMVADALGRPVKITAPDQSVTTFLYAGDRKVERTVSIATSTTTTQAVTTKEYYDAQRRLVKVEEQAANTSKDVPLGGLVTTSYTYDVGGRLASVAMNDGSRVQSRSFIFDQRGFLQQEQHPETGVISYADYDARGHAGTTTDADQTTSFLFDEAERPTYVCPGPRTNCSSANAVKSFTYGSQFTETNLKGKLQTAVRRNDLPTAGRIDVTESYSYLTTTGQLKARTTLVETVNGSTRTTIKELDYGVNTYDKFGLPTEIRMPACTLNGCSAAQGLATVSFARNAGYLTSVVNFASLGYHPSGMVASVTHLSTPNAMDSYDAADGMARPSKITFGGGTSECPTPGASSITAPASICQGSAGTASVPERPGITHSWQISGGAITSSSIGESISFAPSDTGDVILTVRATNACASYSESQATIATSGAPQPSTITAPSCVDTTGTASVDARSGITHTWQISGGSINSATTGEAITFQANGSAAVMLTVTATNTCNATATSTVSVASSCGAPTPSVITAPTSICGRTFGEASVPARSGITHTWSKAGVLSPTSTSGESTSFIAGASGTVTLTVTATNSSGSTASSVSIPIDPSPLATLAVTTALPIVRGTSAQLKVVLEGAGPWNLVWSDGLTETVAVSPHYRTVTPTVNTTYNLDSVTSSNQTCSNYAVGSGDVTVVPSAPAWVRAQRQADGSVRVTWATVTDAASYVVERARRVNATAEWTSFNAVQPLNQTLTLTSTPVTYVYYVRATSTDGLLSARTGDYTTTATTMWTQSIVAGSTLVKGSDVQELRRAVDAFRYAYNQPAAYPASTTPVGTIRAVDMADLSIRLNEARAGTIGAFVYSGVPAPAPGGAILAQHILQLRVAFD